jgi:hypothetical protein
MADLTRRDRELLQALRDCPTYWPAENGFLPVHIGVVLDGYWTFQGLTVALDRLEQAGLLQRVNDGRWALVEESVA